MDCHILGTFNDEEEVVLQVENLIHEEGYASDELMLVMDKNNEYDKKIESIKNAKVNKVEIEEDNIWEKVKEAFSFGTYDSEGNNNTLEEYGVPHNRAEHYTDALRAGEIVLLADTDAPKGIDLSEVNEEVFENEKINVEEETKEIEHEHISNIETSESKKLSDSITPSHANDMRKESRSDNNKLNTKISEEIDLKPELTGEEETVKKEKSRHAYNENKSKGVVKPKAKNPLNTEK